MPCQWTVVETPVRLTYFTRTRCPFWTRKTGPGTDPLYASPSNETPVIGLIRRGAAVSV